MNFKTLTELKDYCDIKGYKIEFSENTELFSEKKKINQTELNNRFAILPMEGNDANEDGSPSTLTRRRYLRYAESGAALIWFEAVAVVREGRASLHQQYLTAENKEAFRELIREIKEEGLHKNGFVPCVIAQLTHSGRYSKPDGSPRPHIAAHNPVLDAKYNIPAACALITDAQLEKLEEDFVSSARLALEAGFDGVDLKASHGYLLCELLSGYKREGKYGNSYEGRTRFLKNITQKVRRATSPAFLIASRITVWDAQPYPYGFGMDKNGSDRPDFAEPVRLIKELRELGLDMIGPTMGNPYLNPHISRPFDKGAYAPPEDPLLGVSRFLDYTAQVKKMVPEVPVVGAGYTYLRQFGVQAAAYGLENGHIDMMGIGRQAFACPRMISDILEEIKPDPRKLCVACSKCTQIMRNGGQTGCPVRDPDIYLSIYRQYCK